MELHPRSLLERLSRGRILSRRLPTRFGGARVFVSPDAALRYWRWDLEGDAEIRGLGDFASAFVSPGDVAWDVGASMGMFTYFAAARAGRTGRVVAIEPERLSLECLLRTVPQLPGEMAAIDVLPLAVSDRNDIETLEIPVRGRCSSHLSRSEGCTQTGGTRARMSVPTVTIDWLAERRPPPRVMKVDIEGVELDLLRGAEGLLRQHRPVLLCEIFGANSVEATKLFRRHEYRLRDFDCPGWPEVAEAPWNTIAVPEERAPSAGA